MKKYAKNIRKAVARFLGSRFSWKDKIYRNTDTEIQYETESGDKIIYFTFDDGPHPKYSKEVMNEFVKYNGTVTFFVVGKRVKKFPEIIIKQSLKGHYIANHTNTHPHLNRLNKEQFINEIETTKEAIMNVAGNLFTLDNDVRYLRPPYGAMDDNTRIYTAELGYDIVLWNIDTLDYRRPGAEAIAKSIMENAHPGAIVLLHDGGGDRSQTIEALKIVLPELDKQGYVFKNIFFKYNSRLQ